MKSSPECVNFIKGYESFSSKPYRCPSGVLTIGYGHTGKGTLKSSITEAEALIFLKEDLFWAEKTIHLNVKVFLMQHEFDALVSLVFNIGSGNFTRSTLLKKLNAQDKKGAAAEFLRWNKGSGGRVLPGLVSRRKREQEVFLNGW